MPPLPAAQLDEREQAGFPPFAYQALLSRRSARHRRCPGVSRGGGAPPPCPLADTQVSLYDPVPMRLFRLKNRERAQLLVESTSRPALQAFLAAWMETLYALKMPAGLRWHLDVDPLEF
jgi:primosomal protein N' (replication factor Y)